MSTITVIKRKEKTQIIQSFKEGETVIFSDLKVGDYIVHRTHGIGEYSRCKIYKADGVNKRLLKQL